MKPRTLNLNLIALIICILSGEMLTAALSNASAVDNTSALDSLMDKGNHYYMDRQYELAADTYMKIVKEGIKSADLYYNMGNAYFKTGYLGKSILFYERALRLSPNDNDILQNLSIARSRTIDNIEEIPQFFIKRWLVSLRNIFSPDQWAIINIISFAFVLFFFLLFVTGNKYRIRKACFITGTVLLVINIIGISMMLSRTRDLKNNNIAIIMISPANAKSSPDFQSTNVFVLHEGTKVIVTDSIQNWKEIRIADGNQGWVPVDAIEGI